jgi:hypothetical protein
LNRSRLDKRSIPSDSLVIDLGLKLFGNTAQHISAHRIDLTAEKADHSLGLERLDSPFSRIRSKQQYPKRMLSLWCSQKTCITDSPGPEPPA